MKLTIEILRREITDRQDKLKRGIFKIHYVYHLDSHEKDRLKKEIQELKKAVILLNEQIFLLM